MAVEITTTNEAEKTTIAVSGRLDTTAAPDLEATLDEVLPGAKDLTFDFAGLEFIASSGLRAVLRAQKAMNEQGSMRIVNVCDAVMEVFDITGFMDFLVIE